MALTQKAEAMLAEYDAKALARFREVVELDTTGPRHRDESKKWWKGLLSGPNRVEHVDQAVAVLTEQQNQLDELDGELASLMRRVNEKREKVKHLRLAVELCAEAVARRATVLETLADIATEEKP